jgi:hypothetical protein
MITSRPSPAESFHLIPAPKSKFEKARDLFSVLTESFLSQHGKIPYEKYTSYEAQIARLFVKKYPLWILLQAYAEIDFGLRFQKEYPEYWRSDSESLKWLNAEYVKRKNVLSYKIKKMLGEGVNPNHYPNWLSLIYGNVQDNKEIIDMKKTLLPDMEYYELAQKGFEDQLFWEFRQNSSIHNPHFYLSVGTHSLLFPREMQELLFSYGLNPIEVDEKSENRCLALELAEHANMMENAVALRNAFSKPERPLKDMKSDLQITNVTSFHSQKKIFTLFEFSNNMKISTILKMVTELTEDEKDFLFVMFEKYFQSNPPGKAIREILKNDLVENSHNKFVEIIYNDKKMIGFNLFEIIQIQLGQKHVVVHALYALLEPQFRNIRIMPYLILRPAFALQTLYPQGKVGTFFNSIHINSYLLVSTLVHYPKYQTAAWIALINKILNSIYGNDVRFVTDGTMKSYIEEKDAVSVKGARYTKGEQDKLYHVQSFFYRDILDGKETGGAPVYVEASAVSFYQLADLYMKMGMSISEENPKLAILFQLALSDLLPGESITTLKSHVVSIRSNL